MFTWSKWNLKLPITYCPWSKKLFEVQIYFKIKLKRLQWSWALIKVSKMPIVSVSKLALVYHCGRSSCWTIFDKANHSAHCSHTYFITHPIGSMYIQEAIEIQAINLSNYLKSDHCSRWSKLRGYFQFVPILNSINFSLFQCLKLFTFPCKLYICFSNVWLL